MAKFIQSDVAGGVILAGKRTGQTAAWAGIGSLQVWFCSMLIPHSCGFSSGFVTVETPKMGLCPSHILQTPTAIHWPAVTEHTIFYFLSMGKITERLIFILLLLK
jgi:hypothetical protein